MLEEKEHSECSQLERRIYSLSGPQPWPSHSSEEIAQCEAEHFTLAISREISLPAGSCRYMSSYMYMAIFLFACS